jgi:uncharacterized membrane protein YuzA (DUF378 family)
MGLKTLDVIALLLVIIGGIDLGIVGVFNEDLIIDLFSDFILAAQILFFLIGVAACYMCYRFGDIIRELHPPSI